MMMVDVHFCESYVSVLSIEAGVGHPPPSLPTLPDLHHELLRGGRERE